MSGDFLKQDRNKKMGKKFLSNKILIGIYVFCSLLITIGMNGFITTTPIQGDATQNLRMAYYLYNEGTFAMLSDSTGSPMPTNYREPVPPAISAFFMFIHPDIDRGDSLESFKNGENTKNIKQVNLIWLFLLQLGIGLTTYALVKNRYLPFLSWILVVFYFIRFGNNFDLLYTEIPAATLIVWTTYFLSVAFQKQKLMNFFVAGISFGFLILTKAAFFYLFPVILLPLFLLKLNKGLRTHFALLLCGTLIVSGYWLIRNVIVINDFGITHRGGGALYNRAVYNGIESDERVAAYYLWGPELYKKIVAGTSLDVNSDEFATGGKYETLVMYPSSDSLALELSIPSMAVSYHSKFRIESNRLGTIARKQGKNREEARAEAFGILKQKSIDIILEHPLSFIHNIPLFFWRGLWCFPNSTIPLVGPEIQVVINNLINLFAYLSLFGLFIYGLLKHNFKFFVFAIIPVSMLVFYGVITLNIPRYSEPAIPSMLISFSILFYYLINIVLKRKNFVSA